MVATLAATMLVFILLRKEFWLPFPSCPWQVRIYLWHDICNFHPCSFIPYNMNIRRTCASFVYAQWCKSTSAEVASITRATYMFFLDSNSQATHSSSKYVIKLAHDDWTNLATMAMSFDSSCSSIATQLVINLQKNKWIFLMLPCFIGWYAYFTTWFWPQWWCQQRNGHRGCIIGSLPFTNMPFAMSLASRPMGYWF